MSKGEYVLTEDTGAIVSELYGGVSTTNNATYLGRVASILTESSVESNVRVFDENEIESSLEKAVITTLDNNLDAVCVILDRFLCAGVAGNPRYADSIRRLSITRSYDGEKISRPNQLSIDDQIAALVGTVRSQQPIYIVDDGFFSGGTATDVIKRLQQLGLRVDGIIGFLTSNESSFEDVSVTTTQTIPQLDEWIDIRDFGIFGGKINKKGLSGRAASAVPYIAPWSDGAPASLNMQPDFFDISINILNAQRDLLASYEEDFGPLTMRDMVRAGFAVPTNTEKSIPLTLNTNVVDYIKMCAELVEREKKRDVLIIDMDGTLYDLIKEDGSLGQGYGASRLKRQVEANALRFIADQTNTQDPLALLQKGLADPVGISAMLQQDYSISRSTYYNAVWDIDPEGLVGVEESVKEAIIAASGGVFGSQEKKLVLLTSAPDVWVKRVLNYLGLADRFEAIYTGEMYGEKQEVMQMLAARYNPKNMISIGDQILTDIAPAQALGMSARLVSSATQTARVIQEVIS